MFKSCRKWFIWTPSPLQSPNLVALQCVKSLSNTAKPHPLPLRSSWWWPPEVSWMISQSCRNYAGLFDDLHPVTAGKREKPWTGNQQLGRGSSAVLLSSRGPIIKLLNHSLSLSLFICETGPTLSSLPLRTTPSPRSSKFIHSRLMNIY